jgi:hypothetical protein
MQTISPPAEISPAEPQIICPLDSRIGLCASDLQDAFQSPQPLKDLIVLRHLLAPEPLQELLNACQTITWRNYAVWSTEKEGAPLQSGYEEMLNPDWYYLSLHQRPSEYPDAFKRIEALMGNDATLQLLSEMTGLKLSRLGYPNTLTGWGPDCFLGAHCDAGKNEEPASLVISLSLAQNWDRDFGGSTEFQWQGGEEKITVWPQCNQAVLFAPHLGSYHWVNPIYSHAPQGRRITWTLHYY